MNFKSVTTITFLSLTVLGLTACQTQTATQPASQEAKAGKRMVSPQSDFYQYVNQDWLEKTKIPSDQPMYGVSSELTDKVQKNLKEDLKNLNSGKEKTELEGMTKVLEFYKIATDFDKREEDGVSPAQVRLKEIEKLTSLEELQTIAKDWDRRSLPLPFKIGLMPDPHDTDRQIPFLDSATPLMIDPSLYQDEQGKEMMLETYRKVAKKLMVRMGYTEEKSKQIVNLALTFDQALAPYLMSGEQTSDVKNTINIRTNQEVATYSDTLAVDQLIQTMLGRSFDKINVGNPAYFEHLNEFLNDGNFESLKAWLLLQSAMADAPYLDQKTANIAGEFEAFVSGIKESPAKEDIAFDLTGQVFQDTLGIYYGKKYFGEEAKKDVEAMVKNIITVYKERLETNDWLSEKTKEKAIKKLDMMGYGIGYPDKISQVEQEFKPNPQKSLLENIYMVNEIGMRQTVEKMDEPIDRNSFVMPAFQINAAYDPSINRIIFPAAILQAPFYSKKQSLEENYGAIGTIIAHEITHAFDNNGALNDEKGNMVNWWTKEDEEAFKVKMQAMIKQWDGLESQGGKVNGRLTVSENIADAAGLSASLEALEKTKGKDRVDRKVFFESYARSWRSKTSPEMAKILLQSDVHAPDKLRANIQLKNLDAFHKTYDTKEGDGMYLPKEERLSIW